MKSRLLATVGGVLLALSAGPAGAQSIDEALTQAYAANPQLGAARAQLRATDEQVPQAFSGFLPTVQADASVGRSLLETNATNGVIVTTPRTASVTATQSVFSGFSTVRGLSRAENVVRAQRAALQNTEQVVLLQAATAYINVVRDQAVVDLTTNNEQVLRRQLDAARDRFRVGEITRTDVSQSESRLSRASADRISAEGQLNLSRATYLRAVGQPPGRLEASVAKFELPTTVDEVLSQARQSNPAVVAARFSESAARDSVGQVRGQLLPQVSVVAQGAKQWESGSIPGNVTKSGTIVARVSMPLYEAGAITSRVREAKQTASQRLLEVEDAIRVASQNAVQAWEALVTSRASVLARQDQLRSAQIALEGVKQEAAVGSRTILDTLNAEQEVLDAQVNLVRDQNSVQVASYQVMAAIGRLTAAALKLQTPIYDPTEHYKDVRHKIWGLGD